MLNEYIVTLNVAIICLTLLAALYLLRKTIDRVSKQKHTVFMLLLPFGITWMLAAGEKASEIEEVVKLALLRRTRNPRVGPPADLPPNLPPPNGGMVPTELTHPEQ